MTESLINLCKKALAKSGLCLQEICRFDDIMYNFSQDYMKLHFTFNPTTHLKFLKTPPAFLLGTSNEEVACLLEGSYLSQPEKILEEYNNFIFILTYKDPINFKFDILVDKETIRSDSNRYPRFNRYHYAKFGTLYYRKNKYLHIYKNIQRFYPMEQDIFTYNINNLFYILEHKQIILDTYKHFKTVKIFENYRYTFELNIYIFTSYKYRAVAREYSIYGYIYCIDKYLNTTRLMSTKHICDISYYWHDFNEICRVNKNSVYIYFLKHDYFDLCEALEKSFVNI